MHQTGVYDDHGIRFLYPESWTLEESQSGSLRTITVESPGTAFLMVALDDAQPSEHDMADQAISTLRGDYPSLEADRITTTIADRPAVGHNVNFFSLDLTITGWIRSFETARYTVLLLFQTSDLELDEVESLFEAICRSMVVDDDS